MWYLNPNAIIAMIGMVLALLAARKWPQSKRLLMLAFALLFLYVYSPKLLTFYAIYTFANYVGFRFLCHFQRWLKTTFVTLVLLNVGAVCLMRLMGMHVLDGSSWFDMVMLIGLIFNVLKVIDAYYFAYYVGPNARTGLVDYANYILFIPVFTSGPIMKFRDFIADAKEPYTLAPHEVEANIKRIILGLFKKIVVVKLMSDYVFGNLLNSEPELHAWTSITLMILFYIQIYIDFSGYSDIAIGFGRLMGYNVPENFKKPFHSPTLTQFWRNWHATLGDWFRDHIFMFFARSTPSRPVAALLSITIMVLIGLWHGFAWIYFFYGLYHGIVIALENLLGISTIHKKKVKRGYYVFRWVITQSIVTFSVIIYCGDLDTVLKIYRGLLNWW